MKTASRDCFSLHLILASLSAIVVEKRVIGLVIKKDTFLNISLL